MAAAHDLIVIGMGVGGEEVAGRAAEAGLDVLAIERRLIGGECAYWACIPTKAMVRAAASVGEAVRANRLAGRVSIAPSWVPVAARVREVTGSWDDTVAIERHVRKGETVLKAAARITGPREVEVDGERHTATKGIVLATGSVPAIPPIAGIHDVDFWTNVEAVESEEVPSTLAVLGAGPVGLELAQVYARFGCRVTVIEGASHVLPAEEPENALALQEVLEEEGITVKTGATATSVKNIDDDIRIDLSDGGAIEAERLLIATGRKVDLGAVGAGAAGVDETARAVDVDERMRAGEGLWAVGDVTGVAPFTHTAVYQGRIAAADILGRDHAAADYSAVPRVTFTDPEVASVGLSAARAEEEGIEVATAVSATGASSRGWIHGPGADRGVIKLVADKRANVLVGASVMAPAAGELVGFLVLAIKEKIPVPALRDLIYPYPTFIRGLEDPLRELEDAT
ncbi:MAG: NAD(P)/FAD-dependent oxidoreductase [Actinomycetota bacterium]|nr:NAD(P)/FAD-dependent oxidoreductase [Actinomycetota bacterium]